MTILTPRKDLLVPPGTNAKVRSAAVAKIMARKVELDIPELIDLPWQPDRWLMVVSQVTISKVGSFEIPEQMQEDQHWTSGVGRIIALGQAVYMGRQFADKGLTPEDAPKVGDFVIFNAKTPLRFKYRDRTYITINDDATLGRVASDRVEDALNNISFTY
jgi:co-chaperonin GroES (HSP10)